MSRATATARTVKQSTAASDAAGLKQLTAAVSEIRTTITMVRRVESASACSRVACVIVWERCRM
jgi:hypothetical protein